MVGLCSDLLRGSGIQEAVIGMNEFSSKMQLLLAGLKQYESIPVDQRQSLLEGMSSLIDQLIERVEGHPEHDYEYQYLKTVREYVEQAFKHPEHRISDMAIDLCSRIASGIPD